MFRNWIFLILLILVSSLILLFLSYLLLRKFYNGDNASCYINDHQYTICVHLKEYLYAGFIVMLLSGIGPMFLCCTLLQFCFNKCRKDRLKTRLWTFN